MGTESEEYKNLLNQVVAGTADKSLAASTFITENYTLKGKSVSMSDNILELAQSEAQKDQAAKTINDNFESNMRLAALPKSSAERSAAVANPNSPTTVYTLEKNQNASFLKAAETVITYGLEARHPDILLTPKSDNIAKIFVVPTWDSADRNNLVKGEVLNDSIYATTDFFLESVQEQEAEKYQIIETFGENKVYFYGSRPKVYSFSGRLLNTSSHQWKTSFFNNYEEKLRGTKCAENKQRIYLVYDDVLVEGYILNISVNTSADSPSMCPFGFTMFITNALRTNITGNH